EDDIARLVHAAQGTHQKAIFGPLADRTVPACDQDREELAVVILEERVRFAAVQGPGVDKELPPVVRWAGGQQEAAGGERYVPRRISELEDRLDLVSEGVGAGHMGQQDGEARGEDEKVESR